MSKIPLGEPGLGSDASPNKSFDQAPHTRRAFSYQDYAAYALLLDSLQAGPHKELWIEHHEDILAVRHSGQFDIYQVKTRVAGDSPWTMADEPIHHTLTRFCKLEASHGDLIATFNIYSNVKPYIPAKTASVATMARSILKLIHELVTNKSATLLPEYEDAFQTLLRGTNAAPATLSNVLIKLNFISGPALDSFHADLPTNLCIAEPELEQWPITDIRKLQQDIIQIVKSAGEAGLPPLSLHTSPIAASGIAVAEIQWRRIPVEAIQRLISQWIRKRRRNRKVIIVGALCPVLLIGGVLLRPILQETPLQHSLNTVQAASAKVLPAEFKESIAIIRAAGKPLDKINLGSANIECQDMSKLTMRRASGQYMHATGVDFDDSILAGSDFSHSELNGAKFRHTRMDGALFENSNMNVANFYGAEVRNAKMIEATLVGANLSRGVFSNGDFKRVDFTLAEMTGADFSNADVGGATINDADVSGADFSGSKNLTQEMLSTACVLEKKPPILDKPLTPPTKSCYSDQKEHDERRIKQYVILFTSQIAVAEGYCKNNDLQFRASDSKLHPESNTTVWLDGNVLDDRKEN